MTESTKSTYDEIPYDNNPFYRTHPDRLATAATLGGLKPPNIERCRVLELGCGIGGNLIPMALGLPNSEFVGIDLSARQIEEGQKTVSALGLTNIQLLAHSILDVDDDFGQFDYIISHGVFSWVPAEVREKILSVSKRNLSPNGLAYISYNTYPGWHTRGMVREMMCFHVRKFKESRERVQQARAFLDFLVESVKEPNTTYGLLLQEEANLLKRSSDTYIFHEHLEDVNFPMYFHEFAEKAAAHGLQYVGESKVSAFVNRLADSSRAHLDQWSDNLIEREQYLDFLRDRTFRQSILCHADVPIERQFDPQRLFQFKFTALARPLSPKADVASTAVEKFENQEGVTATTNNPLVKATLVTLVERWPGAIPFVDLHQLVRDRLSGMPADEIPAHDEISLANCLWSCYHSDLVEFHSYSPPCVLEIGERPIASPLARLQAKGEEALVTNMRHLNVQMSAADRLVLGHLDGTCDRATLIERLIGAVQSGELAIEVEEGAEKPDAAQIREMVESSIGPSLTRIAASSLLVG